MVGRSPKATAQEAAATAQEHGDPSPAAARGEVTRQRLRAAAVELLLEAGWGAVSTRAIAQRAGVRPGLVHYHFPSVTDLLVDATVPALTGLVDELVTLLEAAEDGPAGIDAMVAAAAGYAAGYAAGDPVSRLTTEAFLAATRVPRLQAELAAVLTQVRARLADWLRRCGLDRDAESTATVLAAAFDGLLLHLAVDEHTDLAGAARTLRALVGPRGGAAGAEPGLDQGRS